MADLKSLLIKLIDSELDFVLVGGFAASVHGSTLVTQDIDICAAITVEQVEELRRILADLHPIHRMNRGANLSFLEHPKTVEGVNNIYLDTDLGTLDILSEVPPAGKFDEIRARSIELSIYGKKCRVVSVEDLIKIKDSMGRPKDIQTSEELKVILKKPNV